MVEVVGPGGVVRYNPFSVNALARCIRAGDSERFGIDLKKDRAAILADAAANANAGSVNLDSYHVVTLKGRRCVSQKKEYEAHLVYRSLSRYINRHFKLKIRSRDEIIRGVVESLMDATPMYILRRDITSFYESIVAEKIRDLLLLDEVLPRLVRHYLRLYFSVHCVDPARGLPRGLGLSAVLAELYMREFDRSVKEIEGVYKYFRFADDIVIFSYLPVDNVERKLRLPDQMAFNRSKSVDISIQNDDKDAPHRLHFDYLGYEFSFDDLCVRPTPRTVSVTISDQKIKRLKTRTILALKAYEKDGDAALLLDRLSFLSTNYRVRRNGVQAATRARYVKSGIFYNYRFSRTYEKGVAGPADTSKLKALDGFYRSLISSYSSRFHGTVFAKLTPAYRTRLLRVSFNAGFSSRIITRFTPFRVGQIKSAWANV